MKQKKIILNSQRKNGGSSHRQTPGTAPSMKIDISIISHQWIYLQSDYQRTGVFWKLPVAYSAIYTVVLFNDSSCYLL